MLDLLLDNNFLSSIVAFAIILIPAIIIHELGHFFAAKMVGINVLEFGIGFPPRMIRLFTWGETEFTLNWLPIGGFVRPLGEDMIGPRVEESYEEEFDDDGKPKNVAYISEREELMARGVPEHKLQSVNDTKPLPRIWFMVAGAVFNVVSAVIFFIIAALTGLRIEMGESALLTNISDASIFNQAQVYEFDIVERINGEYYETPAQLIATIATADEPVTIQMRHSNNVKEIEGATRRPFEAYEITVNPQDISDINSIVQITAVVEESPADIAGLQAGDYVIAVNGESADPQDPTALIISTTSQNPDIPITFSILRDGNEFDIQVTPRPNEDGEGRVGIGIAPFWITSDGTTYRDAITLFEYIPQDVGTSVVYGFSETGRILQLIASIPQQMINGSISGEEARPVSIVGISQIGGQFLQQSIRYNAPFEVLTFIALISIFLGITNLLPIPALDGGRILFVIIEIIRGKPIPPQIEARINMVGIWLLLILGAIVIVFDIVNPISLVQ